MTENEKIELFDKWYDENYDEWAEVEEGIALREELEQAFKGGIAELEKENAELKDDNKVMADNYSRMEQKFYDNLTKAKEIIKTLADDLSMYSGNYQKELLEAKQFLNSEVDK